MAIQYNQVIQMNPYSHYWLASKIAPSANPDRLEEYYLGAIIPDIRYLAGIPRDQTHISRTQIQKYRTAYPHLESFLRGFEVHCLIDEINIVRLARSAFPFNLLKLVFRRNFSQQQIAVLAELYFMETTRMDWNISETHNEVLTDLGITPSQTVTFLNAMKEYLPAPSIATALSCFQKIGLLRGSRPEIYLQAYRSIDRNRLLKKFLLMGIKNAGIDQYAVSYVRSTYRQRSIRASK